MLSPARDRYVYYPNASDVPESQAVNVRNRSFTIGAAGRHSSQRGPRGAVRTRIALRWPLPLYRGQPAHYVYNFVGTHEFKVVGDRDVPTGTDLLLSASFDKQGEDPPGVAAGVLSIYHGETKVGEMPLKTQPGKFMLAGEGLCIGRDSGAGVTDYAGTPPFRFTGGTITRVAVDVSGQPYVDLEREAAGMLIRE